MKLFQSQILRTICLLSTVITIGSHINWILKKIEKEKEKKNEERNKKTKELSFGLQTFCSNTTQVTNLAKES